MSYIGRDAHGFPMLYAEPPPLHASASPAERPRTPVGTPTTEVVSTGEAAHILGMTDDPLTARELLGAADIAAVLAWRREDVEALRARVPGLLANGTLKRRDGS